MNTRESCITAVLVLFSFLSFAECCCCLYADPDFFRSSIGVTSERTPVISVAENFTVRNFSLGAMIEVRNERRFNQEIFPNHNWRGVVRTQYPLYAWINKLLEMTFYTGLYHESAHPTMGIVEPTHDAYEMIYDHSYRRMILNALTTGGSFRLRYQRGTLLVTIRHHLYFMSKNTPELSGSALTYGHGVSSNIQWEYDMNDHSSVYISLFDRFIFDSSAKVSDNFYSGNGIGLTISNTAYPIIHKTNTLTLKTGIYRAIGTSGISIGLFTGFLYGNKFGFIDSRDTRALFSAGFEIL